MAEIGRAPVPGALGAKPRISFPLGERGFVLECFSHEDRVPGAFRPLYAYSYRSASAGSIFAAEDDG